MFQGELFVHPGTRGLVYMGPDRNVDRRYLSSSHNVTKHHRFCFCRAGVITLKLFRTVLLFRFNEVQGYAKNHQGQSDEW